MVAKATKPSEDIELHEDAWPRFERFITQVAKGGPQHRTAPKKARPASKERVRKGKSRP